MTATLIILLVIVALIAVSLALGRTTREAQVVRDDEFVELEGSWIRYHVTGSGPPVLLVHGLLSSSKIWEPLVRGLSERFTVYSLDLRGFGESDKPLAGYGVRHGSRLLYSFCARFGLSNTALVGHDVGGDMVAKLAADHPELVRSVILVSTPANEEQIDLPTTLWLATLPVIGPLFYATGQYVGFVRKLWMRPFVSDKKDLPDELIEDSASSAPAALRSTFNTVRREISRERLARQASGLRVPMLIMTGDEDQIVDPQAAEAWAAKAPRSEVALLEGCGHLPMIELPEEFNARLLSFFTGDESHVYGRSLYSEPEASPHGGRWSSTEEPGGIDGLEPDEEASTAAPEEDATRAPDKRGRERERYQEDETRNLGYSPNVDPVQEEKPAGAGGGSRRGGRGGSRGEDLIPELPDDLFRWSDLPQSGRRGRRESGNREERSEDIGGGSREKDEYPEDRDDRG